MSRDRASNDAADALHAIVFDTVTAEIAAYRAKGEPVPPALIAQAIKLLKDNGIDQPAQKGNRVDTLKDAMPNFDELEGNVIPIKRA